MSESDALDGTATPSDPSISATGGDTGTLYIWAQNTVKLNSLAYDVISADTDKVKITANQYYNPLVASALNRWDPPANLGMIDAAGNLLNMYGIAVTAQGLNPATLSLDAGYDAVAGAALIAEIQYAVQGAPCVSGCTMVGVDLQLGDGVYGTYEGANPAETTNGFATIMVAMGGDGGTNMPPTVDSALTDAYPMQPVQHMFTGDDDGGAQNLTWELLSFANSDNGAAVPTNAPTFNAATQQFDWLPKIGDLLGQPATEWVATVQATDMGNPQMSGQGTLTITLLIPEPGSFALAGLAMLGLVGLVRRRG